MEFMKHGLPLHVIPPMYFFIFLLPIITQRLCEASEVVVTIVPINIGRQILCLIDHRKIWNCCQGLFCRNYNGMVTSWHTHIKYTCSLMVTSELREIWYNKHTYELFMNHFNMLIIINMATTRNFNVMSDKFNVVVLFTGGNDGQ